MAITLEHFCTKTNQPIIVDGQPVTETIEHCLAAYFAPDATYKIGAVYPGITTEADLQNLQAQGLTLQFASDDRFYFMDEQLREKVFDRAHFGAAYGSKLESISILLWRTSPSEPDVRLSSHPAPGNLWVNRHISYQSHSQTIFRN